MNPRLQLLHPYPFPRLAALLAGAEPPAGLDPIPLSIGEPRHAPPAFIGEALTEALDTLDRYPVARGIPELRAAIGRWLERRYRLPGGRVNPETQVLPVNGTREGLFAFVQAVVDFTADSLVMMPNPFYQIYEGAALLAGATPRYMDLMPANGFLPDLDAVSADEWDRCALLFLCSPGNPTGTVMGAEFLQRALELADRHDFVVASDECYADIYFDEDRPPTGLLEVCEALGRHDFSRCIVFHSLSKRSSVPGLRSGFVAGDAHVMQGLHDYRTYHGCAVPVHTQLASVPAWDDEDYVAANRRVYQDKLEAVFPILEPVLDVPRPEAAFYLWARTPVDDETFTRGLFETQHVTALPGSYLSRPGADGRSPGADHVRLSLVAPLAACVDAAERIRDYCRTL